MNRRAPPPWLGEFQAAFGQVLLAPLERASGTLRARTDAYTATLHDEVLPGPRLAAVDRIAVYHRQYWFRLLTALQTDYPLVAHLLGFWEFNGWAARFLSSHPPRCADIQRAGDGFPDFLDSSLPAQVATGSEGLRVPRDALLEAVAIDAAWRAILLAPDVLVLDPVTLEGPGAAQARLERHPAFAIVSEHWPLCALRAELVHGAGVRTGPLPPRRAEATPRLLGRLGTRLLTRELEPLHAALLHLLAELPLADGLAELEASCPEAERAGLPAKVQGWLSESVRIGYWRGGGRDEG